MVLQELTAYLEEYLPTLDLEVGRNLYRGPLQPSAQTALDVALVPRFGSRPSETDFGAADLRYEWPRVRVVVRGPELDRAAADAKAHALYLALGKIQATQLSGTSYHQVRCLQPPYLDRYDENKRPLVQFEIDIEKEVSAA